jgi:hypothetical protein
MSLSLSTAGAYFYCGVLMDEVQLFFLGENCCWDVNSIISFLLLRNSSGKDSKVFVVRSCQLKACEQGTDDVC